jgi:hypothetical protein
VGKGAIEDLQSILDYFDESADSCDPTIVRSFGAAARVREMEEEGGSRAGVVRSLKATELSKDKKAFLLKVRTMPGWPAAAHNGRHIRARRLRSPSVCAVLRGADSRARRALASRQALGSSRSKLDKFLSYFDKEKARARPSKHHSLHPCLYPSRHHFLLAINYPTRYPSLCCTTCPPTRTPASPPTDPPVLNATGPAGGGRARTGDRGERAEPERVPQGHDHHQPHLHELTARGSLTTCCAASWGDATSYRPRGRDAS